MSENQPIHILFVFGCALKKGGTENVMINICKNIDKDNFRIDFLIFEKVEDTSEDKKMLESLGCVFYYITARRKSWKKHYEELTAFFQEHEYDIVHTHMDAIGEEALKVAKKAGVSVRVAHSHNTDQLASPNTFNQWLHRQYLIYEKYLLRYYANFYIACSPEAGTWLFGERLCKEDHYLLLNNSIDSNKYEFNKKIRETKRKELLLQNRKIVIHVGQFRKEKNHQMILNIFKILYERNRLYCLVLVGDGEEREHIEDVIKQYGLEQGVMLLGTRTDIAELLQMSDVFLFPSHHEGLGIAILEAQASDLVCVIADNIPSKAIVTEKVIPLSLKEVPEVWADTIDKSIDKMKTRKSRTQDFIQSGYDIKSQIKVLESFYRKAIEK